MTNIDATARFQVHKEGRKWFVDDTANPGSEPVDGPFKTRHLAEDSATQLNLDNPDEDVEPEATEVDQDAVDRVQAVIEAAVVETEADCLDTQDEIDAVFAAHEQAQVVDPAGMSRTERILAAKVEVDSVRAWRAAGCCDTDVPATPVLDWMADPANDGAKRAAPASERKTHVYTGDQLAAIKALVTTGRSNGVSWGKIAVEVEATGIPTARGGKWYDTTVSDLARKQGWEVTAKAS